MYRNLYLLLASLLPLSSLAQPPHHHGAPARAVSATPAATVPAATVPAATAPAANVLATTVPATAAPAIPAQSGGAKITGLESYRRFNADEPLADWHKVNDTVRDVGGWRVYSQEAARAIKAEQDSKAAAMKGTKP